MSMRLVVCTLLIFATLSADDEAAITQPFRRHASVPSFSKGVTDKNPKADSPIAMANLEGAPSSFVHQCVNVITGQFCDSQTDLIVHHAVDPITIDRHYLCDTSLSGVFGAAWEMNHCSGLIYETFDKSPFYTITQDNGGWLYYENYKENNQTILKLIPSCINRGVANNATGNISGQTNLKNQYIKPLDKKNVSLISGTGCAKTYTKLSHTGNDIFSLSAESKPSGNKFIYKHQHSHLDCIELTNSAGKCVSSLKIPHTKVKDLKKNKEWRISTKDNRWVRYTFNKWHDEVLLKAVDHSDSPSEEFVYCERTLNNKYYSLLWQKMRPDNRFLSMEYYFFGHNPTPKGDLYLEGSYDPRINRVKKLLAPSGHDATPIGIYHFIYDLNIIPHNYYILNGGCEVLDAYGHRSIYGYDENHRLTHVERFHSNGQHYTSEILRWGAVNSQNNTNLTAHALEHKHHGLVFAHTYHYDAKGNVEKDTIYGNLSGHSQVLPELRPDGSIVENSPEGYRKTFTYSDDGLNLVLKETDGIQTTYNKYAPGTNRLTAKFEGIEQHYYRRSFYSYNNDAALVKTITDDGTKEDPNDLTGVTERHITYCTPSEVYPVGYPLVIEEKCLDLATGQELLVHKVVNRYTNQAKIDKQEHYDSQGVFAYVLLWEFDAMGNLLKETDALGQTTTRKYDNNGNCIYEKGPRSDVHKVFSYDFMNRLIREEEVHSDGTRLGISHHYDLMSRRIATIDPNGNKTEYAHDAFGRVIQITYPMVVDADGRRYLPTVKKEYDPMGNVTCEIDANGFETRKRYTVRGQVAEVIHPDGTTETNTYHWDGNLWKSKAKNGTNTSQINDPLGRPTIHYTYSATGELLATTTKTYSSFHLVSETDALGNVTQYTYHPDGKLKSKQKVNSLSTYAYDSLGRLAKTCDQYGPGAADVMVKAQTYDLLNRIVEETVEDISGNIQTRLSYAYDAVGNVNRLTTYPQGLSATTITDYDSHGVPAVVTDALGNKTITTIVYNYRNSFDQGVPYQIVTDAEGNLTATEKDALGRTVSIVRKNAFGKIIQQQESRFDANGNCCQLIDTIISDLEFGRVLLEAGGRIVASAESVARDDIVRERTTMEFVRRRAICQGQVRAQLLSRDALPAAQLAKRAGHLVGGLLRVPSFLAAEGLAQLRRDLPKTAVYRRRRWFAQGRVLGAIGRMTPEYSRSA